MSTTNKVYILTPDGSLSGAFTEYAAKNKDGIIQTLDKVIKSIGFRLMKASVKIDWDAELIQYWYWDDNDEPQVSQCGFKTLNLLG